MDALDRLAAGVDSLNSRFDRAFGELRHTLGLAHEASYRSSIMHEEGHTPGKPLFLDSIDVLTNWLAHCYLEQEPEQQVLILTKLCVVLIDQDVATAMLRTIARQILRVDPAADSKQGVLDLSAAYALHPFLSANNTINCTLLGSFIGMLKAGNNQRHRQLVDTLSRVKKVLVAKTTEGQMRALKSRDGAGMCFALFASEQQRQRGSQGPDEPLLSKYDDITCGQHEVELDVRGNITVIDGTASIWAGEFNSIQVARRQLQLRLELLEWAVRATRPLTTVVTKTGKVFMPWREMHGCEPDHVVGNTLIMAVSL